MLRRHPDTQRDLIVLQITGHLFFICLALVSLFYWRERQAFDAAHYLFELIDRKWFFIAHGRPLGVVSQVLPLVGIWLGVPLKAVAILYSIGDILWYYLIFLFLGYGLQTRQGIIILLLLLSVTVRFSFFCPVTELLQGLALIPVWIALLNKSFRFRFPVLIFVLALIIFSHPLLFIPAAFSFAWWGIKPADYGKLKKIIWPSFAVLLLLKMLLLDSYDHDKTFYPVVYDDYGYIKTMWDPGYILSFLKMLGFSYPLLTILFLTSLFIFTLRKEYKKGLLLFAGVSGFLVIIIATHRFTEITNYSERMLLPLAYMISVAAAGTIILGKDFLPKLLAYVGFVLILLLHFDMLRVTAQPYTFRTKQLAAITSSARKMNIRKGIVNEDKLEQNSFAMSGWSYPLETLLFSAYEGPDSCVTIALVKEHIDRIKEQGNSVEPDEWIKWTEIILPVNTLNQQYFRLPNAPYSPITGKSITSSSLVSLSISSVLPLKTSSTVVEVTVTMTDGRCIAVSEDVNLQLKFESGEIYRQSPAYDLCGTTFFWLELPRKSLIEKSTVSLFLTQQNKVLGAKEYIWTGNAFQEEK